MRRPMFSRVSSRWTLAVLLAATALGMVCEESKEVKMHTYFIFGNANGTEFVTVSGGGNRVYSFSVTDYMTVLPGRVPFWHLDFHVHDGDTLSWMLMDSDDYPLWLHGQPHATIVEEHGCVLGGRGENLPTPGTYYLVFVNKNPTDVELDGYSSVDWWELE